MKIFRISTKKKWLVLDIYDFSSSLRISKIGVCPFALFFEPGKPFVSVGNVESTVHSVSSWSLDSRKVLQSWCACDVMLDLIKALRTISSIIRILIFRNSDCTSISSAKEVPDEVKCFRMGNAFNTFHSGKQLHVEDTDDLCRKQLAESIWGIANLNIDSAISSLLLLARWSERMTYKISTTFIWDQNGNKYAIFVRRNGEILSKGQDPG